MSKKPITITNIEESLYSAIKQEAVSRNITASELVSNIFQSYLDGKSSDPVADYVQQQRCETLQGKIELLNDDLDAEKQKSEEMQNMIHVLNDDLDAAKNLTDALQEDKVKLSEQIETLEAELAAAKTAKDTLTARRENTVQVELSELESALIKHVAEKETKRSGKDITPALLLKTMFSEYCIKGETWFFPFPKRSEIADIKKKLTIKQG